MEEYTRQLAASIETIVYHFGAHGVDEECCENISHGEYRALRAALHKEACTMQDIAKGVLVTKSGATRIIKRLEGKGLVSRERDRADGRICCVTLTQEGSSFLSRIERQLIQDLQAVLERMDPALREILVLSIGAFSHAVTAEAAKKGKAPSRSRPAEAQL